MPLQRPAGISTATSNLSEHSNLTASFAHQQSLLSNQTESLIYDAADLDLLKEIEAPPVPIETALDLMTIELKRLIIENITESLENRGFEGLEAIDKLNMLLAARADILGMDQLKQLVNACIQAENITEITALIKTFTGI